MTTQFKVGDRVILTQEVDTYPLGIWKAGEIGTIASITDNLNGETGLTYFVKLENHFPVLREWDNELQIDVSVGRWGDGEEPPFEFAPTMDDMIQEYAEWNKSQGLNLGSADEHLFDENLTDDQRKWLSDFSTRWERMANYDDERAAIERRFADEERSRKR